MDQLNISKTILSLTSPGSHLVPGDDAYARILARECNEYIASIKKSRPDRFGYWATIPLPDVEGSLSELAYALDELDADGVTMLTNHHGKYLGDASFEPVIAELDRRGATVFIHPTVPCMACGHGDALIDARPMRHFPPAIFEFFFEEVRAVLNLFSSGQIVKYPNVTWIVPHGGGAIPPIVERFTRFGTSVFGGKEEMSSTMFKETLKKQFYFDLSGFPLPDQLHGLLRFVDPTRLLVGTDWPYTPTKTTFLLTKEMDDGLGDVLEREEDREAIYHLNAEKLLGKRHHR